MKLAVVAVAAAVAVVVGITAGWRWVVAPLIGLAVWAWAIATLRSMRGGAHGGEVADPDPEPVLVTSPNERTVFWCEMCGTELLLVVKGSGTPPRHCGERMHGRTEVPHTSGS